MDDLTNNKINLVVLQMLCRRGLKELDLILKGYLKKYYQQASNEEIKEFKSILELEDHSLLTLILNPPKNQSKHVNLLYTHLQNYSL